MYKLVEEQRVENMAGFKEMMRMTYESFQEILAAIEPLITKRQVVGSHKVIPPAVRLIITL